MRDMQLSRVDLNLLPALAALLEERNVSRAADAVGLSQSAMSRALGRLRRLLKDDLLVRNGDGYHLTPAAATLRVQLAQVLPPLQSMFLGRDFTPASETRQFRMTGSDYAVMTFGAAVFSNVLADAPRASIRFCPWHPKVFQELAEGELDLVFSGMRRPAPVINELLFTDEMVCVVHRGHKLARQRSISLDDYLSFGHLTIDIDKGLQPSVDGVLAAMGRPRETVLTMPFHATAPLALLDTQLILSLPARALQQFVAPHGEHLCVFPAPLHVKSLPYFMSWHARADNDPAQRWLRAQVRDAVASVMPALS